MARGISLDETWEGCHCIAEIRKMVGEADKMGGKKQIEVEGCGPKADIHSKDKMSNVVCKKKLDTKRIRGRVMMGRGRCNWTDGGKKRKRKQRQHSDCVKFIVII